MTQPTFEHGSVRFSAKTVRASTLRYDLSSGAVVLQVTGARTKAYGPIGTWERVRYGSAKYNAATTVETLPTGADGYCTVVTPRQVGNTIGIGVYAYEGHGQQFKLVVLAHGTLRFDTLHMNGHDWACVAQRAQELALLVQVRYGFERIVIRTNNNALGAHLPERYEGCGV